MNKTRAFATASPIAARVKSRLVSLPKNKTRRRLPDVERHRPSLSQLSRPIRRAIHFFYCESYFETKLAFS
jgi:hypothetical protein